MAAGLSVSCIHPVTRLQVPVAAGLSVSVYCIYIHLAGFLLCTLFGRSLYVVFFIESEDMSWIEAGITHGT